jgi:hypothetical protein
MSKAKKVILWGRDDLLTKAVEIFLTAGIREVIRIPMEHGADYLVECAKKIKPDVVIVYVDDVNLPLRLIQDQPNFKVVIVSLQDNQMQVYSKHSILVREVSDLLSVIEDRYFLENPV